MKFLDYLQQHNIPLIKQISKLQSNHYRNVSADPLISAEHTLETTALGRTDPTQPRKY
jgi:hypothetical protein